MNKQKALEINRNFYNKYAGEFDELEERKLKNIRDESYKIINRILDRVKKKEIWCLEIGCGSSSLFMKSYHRNIRVIYVDISDRELAILKNKLSEEQLNKSTIICSDINTYLSDCFKFDLICCAGTLHHLPNYSEVLRLICDKADYIYLEREDFKDLYSSFLLRALTFLDNKFHKGHNFEIDECKKLDKTEKDVDLKLILNILKEKNFELERLKFIGGYYSWVINWFVTILQLGYCINLSARKNEK